MIHIAIARILHQKICANSITTNCASYAQGGRKGEKHRKSQGACGGRAATGLFEYIWMSHFAQNDNLFFANMRERKIEREMV